MVLLLIAIFLFILFIVAVALSAKTWRAWHIVVAVLTYLAAFGLLVVASYTVKTHGYWKSEYAKAKASLEEKTKQGVRLEWGDPLVEKQPQPTVNDLQHRHNRELLDRGRVWRSCTPSPPANDDSVVVSTLPPADGGAPVNPDAAKPNGIQANMVLYAFLENEAKLPVAYLGEFVVADAQPNAVTLKPTMPMDGQQRAQWAMQPARWSLYEMMPIDAHECFSDEDTVGRTLNDQPEPVFGEMDDATLRSVFATVVSVAAGSVQPPESPIVSELVAAYLQDGSPATPQDENESPQNIWLKLEFQKEHKEKVDSSNLDPGLGGNFFDPEGYAEVSQLRAGGDASFRVKDVGLFPYFGDADDRRPVNALIDGGIAKKIGPFFVRTLRDYEGAFHDIQESWFRGLEGIQRAKRDIDALNASIASTSAQSQYRHEEQAKLQQDLEGFQRDGKQLGELVAALEAQKKTLGDELSKIFADNVALTQQLKAYSDQLTEEINRRAAEVATVQAP
jgi:hypothetical protein